MIPGISGFHSHPVSTSPEHTAPAKIAIIREDYATLAMAVPLRILAVHEQLPPSEDREPAGPESSSFQKSNDLLYTL